MLDLALQIAVNCFVAFIAIVPYFARMVRDDEGRDVRVVPTRIGLISVGVLAAGLVISIVLSVKAYRSSVRQEADAKALHDELRALHAASNQTAKAVNENMKRVGEQLASLPNREEIIRALHDSPEVAEHVKEAALRVECPLPGEFARGVAQIRAGTYSRKEDAEQARQALMTLLRDSHLADWVKWVMPVFAANVADHQVFLVVINSVEPARRDALCNWLECKGWRTGELKCDLRPR